MAELPDKRTELPEVTICIHKHGLYSKDMFEIPEGIHVNILNAAPVNAVNMVSIDSTKEIQIMYDEYFESAERSYGLPLEDYIQMKGYALKRRQIHNGEAKKYGWEDMFSTEEISNYYRSSGWELLMDPRMIPDVELTSEPGWDDITVLGTTKGPLKKDDKIYPGSRSIVYLSEVIKDLRDRGYKKIFIVNLACRIMDTKDVRDARSFFREVTKLNPSERADPKWFHKGGTRKKRKKSIVKYRRSKCRRSKHLYKPCE
jgi:hypothetical protein